MSSKIICFIRKLLRIDVFEEVMKKSEDFGYLTPEYVSEIEGISRDAAERRLGKASEEGFLRRSFLYTNIDLDLNIIVDESEIGTNIVIDDWPVAGQSTEVFISENYVKKIYVSGESAEESISHNNVKKVYVSA